MRRNKLSATIIGIGAAATLLIPASGAFADAGWGRPGGPWASHSDRYDRHDSELKVREDRREDRQERRDAYRYGYREGRRDDRRDDRQERRDAYRRGYEAGRRDDQRRDHRHHHNCPDFGH